MDFPSLHRLLDELLRASLFAGKDDPNGVLLPSAGAVQRLGLALEPWPELVDWAATHRLDALFLHRPWKLSDAQRRALTGSRTGVFAYHLAFDERLTAGFNPALAAACRWEAPEPFGQKEGRPLGMCCRLALPLAFEAVAAQLRDVFGGLEQTTPPAPDSGIGIVQVAVVGAMTDALVREAQARGVGVYVTGQWRQPARAAVCETGLGVVTLGHQRAERWGLRALSQLLQARCPNLTTVQADQ